MTEALQKTLDALPAGGNLEQRDVLFDRDVVLETGRPQERQEDSQGTYPSQGLPQRFDEDSWRDCEIIQRMCAEE